jgi:hypothetical protein
MTDTIVIEEEDAGTGRKFSWGLALAGGVAATAVTFFLLTLGSGVGLLLTNPSLKAVPAFFSAGAIYFFVAQAFGFAAGGHLAGRLLGPIVESHAQEEFRAAAHGFAAWAVTVLATATMAGFFAIAATGTGALYGAAAKSTDHTPTAYLVDELFRPNAAIANAGARGEAERILDAGLARGEQIAPDDMERLTVLVSKEANLNRDAAALRIGQLQAKVQEDTRHAADIARKTASYASLWIALSLLFGAIVASVAAVMARNQDDRRSLFAA